MSADSGMFPPQTMIRSAPEWPLLAASLVVAAMAVQFQAFASAPTAPSNLTAVVSSAGVIRLDWAASTDDVRVAGYLVERCVGADCTGFVQVASLPASGISGPLKVSTNNPRYFASPSGQTVLLGGSHHWANFSDMGTVYPPPAFDYDAWLDFLSTNRHNFFRLWVEQLPKHNYTIQDAGPWYSTPQPWLRTGPGNASDGLPKFDLTKFNPAYFDRLRERVLKANARGIYVAITLFDGYHLQFDRRPDDGFPLTGTNNINGVDDGGGVNSHILASIPAGVLAAEEDYVRKVIDTVNDLPNVCYEIANEAGGYSTAWQQHMIALIKNYETNKPLQHPVGFTFQYDGGTDASLYASAADWVSPKERFPSNNGTRRVLNNDTDHSYFWTEMKGDGPELNRAFVWRNFCAGNSAMFMDPYLMPWTKSGIVRNAPTGCGPGLEFDPVQHRLHAGARQQPARARPDDPAARAHLHRQLPRASVGHQRRVSRLRPGRRHVHRQSLGHDEPAQRPVAQTCDGRSDQRPGHQRRLIRALLHHAVQRRRRAVSGGRRPSAGVDQRDLHGRGAVPDQQLPLPDSGGGFGRKPGCLF
jgi:hypothetical protein